MIDASPSVLFDAVALMLFAPGAEPLAKEAAARDFVADAFAHCKFIGFTPESGPLLTRAGVDADADEGLVRLDSSSSAEAFIQACRKLRLLARRAAVKL